MSTTVDVAEDAPSAFSLQLSEDQRDIRAWVHGFAADVVRPTDAKIYTIFQRLVIARAISGVQIR